MLVNGAKLMAHHSGAVFWPDQSLLLVADLHLEKGSSWAMAGHFLPPYDTAATLRRLTTVIEEFDLDLSGAESVLEKGISVGAQTTAEPDFNLDLQESRS